MMKAIIGYEAKRANANRTGLGNYSRFVIRAVREHAAVGPMRLYIPKRKENAEYDALLTLPDVASCQPDRPLWRRLSALWRSVGMAPQLRRDGVALFHGLSNELPWGLGRCGIRSVVTIHDLIFHLYPSFYRPVDRWICAWKFRSACRRADRIIAISECTKRDIVRLYGVDPARIEVIYQGCDAMFARTYPAEAVQQALRTYGLPPRYLLNVGTLEERKNLLEIVQALAELPDDLHLVAVGRRTAYTARVERYAAEHGLSHRLHLLHSVGYRDLPLLYAGARMMIYPSRYEGFGIPVIEALSSGLPVVAATGSCLEEAGGPDSCYVSPDDPSELAAAVRRILEDDALRQRMIERGRAYVTRFLPEVVGPRMAALYERLLEP